jgi:DNA-binding PadR family transcriptional regulator
LRPSRPSKEPRPLAQHHIPLTVPVYHILLALLNEDAHGYAILKQIERDTDGELCLGASTLYAAIRRLLAAGMIDELDERPAPELDDSRRRYYRITEYGREVARLEALRQERAGRLARARRILPSSGRPAG